MKRTHTVWLLGLCLPSLLFAQGIQGVHTLTKLGEEVYVAVPRFGGANATIILNDTDVALVDPHSDPATARALIDEVEALTDKPIRYVINTHWHGDHHGGNRALAEAFPGQITFIAHRNTRAAIGTEALPELRGMGAFYATWPQKADAYLQAGVDETGRPLTDAQRAQLRTYIAEARAFVAQTATYEYHLPTLTLDQGLTLHAGTRTLEIRHLGLPAHTRGDLVVYLPDDQIVITGDLLTAPYVVPRSGYPAAYAQTLRKIAAMELQYYVLGHGGPVKADKAFIHTMADFLEAAAAYAAAAYHAGQILEETLASARTAPRLLAFKDRIDWEEPGLRFLDLDGLIAMTIERARLEAVSQREATTSGFAEGQGARLYYEVTGAGPPLVLLHGGFMDRRMWDAQVEAFARHFTVLRYDLRGYGKTEVLSQEPYAPADDLRALLTHLGLARAHIVGLSAGGTVAIDFALTYPERVASLVAAETAPSGFTFSEAVEVDMQTVFRAARTHGRERAIEVFLERPVFATARSKPAAYQQIRALLEDNFTTRFLPQRPLDPPALQRLAQLRMPLLFVYGEDSGPDARRALEHMQAAVNDAETVLIPGAGHMVNLEQPEAFNTAVLAFLRAR